MSESRVTIQVTHVMTYGLTISFQMQAAMNCLTGVQNNPCYRSLG
jgi:hypothetical protein